MTLILKMDPNKNYSNLAIARTGSTTLTEFLKQNYKNAKIHHDHMMTVEKLSKNNYTEIISTCRKPSDRIISGYKRRMEGKTLGKIVNKLFLKKFKSIDDFIESFYNKNHNQYQYTNNNILKFNHNQNYTNSIQLYLLDSNDPNKNNVRIYWINTQNLDLLCPIHKNKSIKKDLQCYPTKKNIDYINKFYNKDYELYQRVKKHYQLNKNSFYITNGAGEKI
jgi:hypothetical protein